MRKFLGIFVAALITFPVASYAQGIQRVCVEKNKNGDVVRIYKPIAVADEMGTVVVPTPDGKEMRISGLPPFFQVCRNLLFPSASRRCPTGVAQFDAVRPARYCKGPVRGKKCLHIAC